MKRRILSSSPTLEQMEVECIEKDSIPSLLKIVQDMDSAVSLVERNQSPCGIDLVARAPALEPSYSSELVTLATEVSKADFLSRTKLETKLSLIKKQMDYLKQEAFNCLKEASDEIKINHLPCNFKKVPGNIYSVYRRPSGQDYLSMLSPQEWDSPPHEFIASYRLEKDMSWTLVNCLKGLKAS